MSDYRVFVSLEIAEAVRLIRGVRRHQIFEFLTSLQSDPFQVGDFQKQQSVRTVEVKVFGQYSIYYWPDHAVKEVKVVDLVRSDTK